jgi:hypothetical protein
MRSSLVFLSLGVLAAAVPLKRSLPTPVSVATAKTYLSERMDLPYCLNGGGQSQGLTELPLCSDRSGGL